MIHLPPPPPLFPAWWIENGVAALEGALGRGEAVTLGAKGTAAEQNLELFRL